MADRKPRRENKIKIKNSIDRKLRVVLNIPGNPNSEEIIMIWRIPFTSNTSENCWLKLTWPDTNSGTCCRWNRKRVHCVGHSCTEAQCAGTDSRPRL